MPEHWKVSELAEELRVSERTIRRMIKRGRFPHAFRVGRSWRIPRRDVAELQKARAPD